MLQSSESIPDYLIAMSSQQNNDPKRLTSYSSSPHSNPLRSALFYSDDSDFGSDSDSDSDYQDESANDRSTNTVQGKEPAHGDDGLSNEGIGNDNSKQILSKKKTLLPNKRPYTFINRQENPRKPASMRTRWIIEVDEIINHADQNKCCKKLACFSNSNSAFLRSRMVLLREMSYENRKQCLSEMMGSNGCFFFDGRQVCTIFLKKAFRFSLDMIAAVRQSPKKGPRTDSFTGDIFSHTTSNSDRGSDQKDSIITCLERLAEGSGDKMPDTDEVHLPFFRKRDVYQYFQKEFEILYGSTLKCPCRSYFYRIWKKDCRNIKVRKLGRFAKCSTCEQLRKSISDAVSRREYKTVEILRQRKREHNEMIARERRE